MGGKQGKDRQPFYNKEQFLRKYERLRIMRNNIRNRDLRRDKKKLGKGHVRISHISWGIKETDFEKMGREDLLLKGYNVPVHLERSNSNFNDYYKQGTQTERKNSSQSLEQEFKESIFKPESEGHEESLSRQSLEELLKLKDSESETISSIVVEEQSSSKETPDKSNDTFNINLTKKLESEINTIQEESEETTFSSSLKIVTKDQWTSKKKKLRRKLGDQISIKPAYIDFTKENQRYVSYWMNCIENCLNVKYLDLEYERIGYDSLFGDRILIDSEKVKNEIFYREDDYIVTGFISYFKIMRRCHFDTEREDEFFKNHNYDFLKKNKKKKSVILKRKDINPALHNMSKQTLVSRGRKTLRDSVFGSIKGVNFNNRNRNPRVVKRRKGLISSFSPDKPSTLKSDIMSIAAEHMASVSRKRGELDPWNLMHNVEKESDDSREKIHSIISAYLKANGEDLSDIF